MKKYVFCCLLLIPVLTSAQRVQISSLPGDDGGMDIEKLLGQIMKPHYDQVSNLRNRYNDKTVEQEIWTTLRTNIENFDRVTRYIFSYESAFRDVTNSVSDPSSLAITAARNAEKGSHRVQIKRLAAPDAFSSAPISSEEKLPAAAFTGASGEEFGRVDFKGGSLEELASAMKASLGSFMDVSVINSSETMRSLLVRGKNPGRNKKITFDGDLAALTQARLLGSGKTEVISAAWNGEEKPLVLSNGSFQKDHVLNIAPNSVLTFSADTSPILAAPRAERSPLNGGALALGEYASEEFTLPGAAPMLGDVAQNTAAKPQAAAQPLLQLHFSDGSVENIALSLSNYRIPLEAGKNLEKVSVSSPRAVSTVQTLVITSSPEEGMEPFNRISRAQDALFSYDGVDLERPSNSVADVSRGVTLELLKEGADFVTFSVGPNKELIENTIGQWVLGYNSVMDYSYHASTLPLAKIGKMKPIYQRKTNQEDYVEGSLLSDSGILSYRAGLRRLTGMPHGAGTFTLLDQIGIYVQRMRGGAPTDPEAVRRGLLTLDTGQLKRALDENFDEVFRLFSWDSLGTGVADQGAAVAAAQANASMIGGNGYITRIGRESIDKLASMDREITKKEETIAKTERTERGNLLRMNQALAAGKAQSEALRQRFGN